MLNSAEYPNIYEVDVSSDKRLKHLTSKRILGDGWGNVVKEVTGAILREPGWLVNGDYLPPYTVIFVRQRLDQIRKTGLKELDDLARQDGDTPSIDAFVMRFIEVFSEKHNFPYVWRGGSLNDLDPSVRGTFTFFVGEAKRFVKKSYDGLRIDPCLIGLPVKSIVDDFKQSQSKMSLQCEHGYDGIFNSSFDVSLSRRPEGTKVYVP